MRSYSAIFCHNLSLSIKLNRHTIPCHTLLYFTILCYTLPYSAIPFSTILYHTLTYSTTLCYTLPSSALLNQLNHFYIYFLGTFSRVMHSVARSFASVSASLEHYGGLFLTDTAFHHCWSFPPYQYCEQEGSSALCGKLETKESVLKQNLFDGKTCCCGAMKLRDLPAGATWQTLLRDEFVAIPEMITKLLDSQGHISDNLPGMHDHGMKADIMLTPDTQCASAASYSKDKDLSSAANTQHSDVEPQHPATATGDARYSVHSH